MSTKDIGFEARKLTGHNGSVYALSETDENRFYSAGGEGWIVEWPIEGSNDGKVVAKMGEQIFSILKIRDRNHVVAGTMSGRIYFIDLDDSSKLRNMDYHQKGVFDLLQLDGRIISAGGDGKLSIWDWEKQTLLESVALSHNRLRGLALSSDEEVLAVGSSDANIYLLHVGSWKIIEVIKQAHDNSVFDVCFAKDGMHLISGGRDAHLKVWSVRDGFSLDQDLAAHWYTINALALHPLGTYLATASRDKTIRIWDTISYTLLATLDVQRNRGHINSVNDLTWSSKGSHLISASDDRSIIIWSFDSH